MKIKIVEKFHSFRKNSGRIKNLCFIENPMFSVVMFSVVFSHVENEEQGKRVFRYMHILFSAGGVSSFIIAFNASHAN